MTAVLETTIIDDDGVAVVAWEAALKARYVDQDFDYEFPNALLEGMRAGEVFAWRPSASFRSFTSSVAE